MNQEVTISALELARLLGSEGVHEQAVLRATLNLGLSFLTLTHADCQSALDWIASDDPSLGQEARFAKPKLSLMFAEKGWTKTMGNAPQPTPLRVPGTEELHPVHERRLELTTTTGEFRRSDYRRSGKRYRRTQLIGLLVDAGLYQEEAEVLVREAVRAVLGTSSSSSMDVATLEQVLQSMETTDPRVRAHTNHVRNALALSSAASR